MEAVQFCTCADTFEENICDQEVVIMGIVIAAVLGRDIFLPST